ncbi:MAG: 4-hydroxythreonine-4-phosphate dehydrogenase 2 [Rhodomicrobium sp.]|nr:MAG: 4-hydroxythreonine-4-phosphate dehydrogenase 2 [Rhodomicrobium sp.]
MEMRLPLAVSIGEPAGIGPDIILKSWVSRNGHGSATCLPFFYVHGSAACLSLRAEQLQLDVDIIKINSPSEALSCFQDGLPVIDIALTDPVVAGELNGSSSQMVMTAIRQSVIDTHKGLAAGVVTAPIHKAVLYEAGFKHPGHTEYLAALADELYCTDEIEGGRHIPVMMLASSEIKVVPVTIHIALSEVPAALSGAKIINTVRCLHCDLLTRFGIKRPRIHLTGLNPHAGEDGTMGREEIEIISPAIDQLLSEGYDVSGPHPADVSFHASARQRYDAAVAMYHDQALIPIKTLAFDEGVNVTLGLPFIRTSPDHGTALNIAGSGLAKPDSFIAALKMAGDMASYSRETSV